VLEFQALTTYDMTQLSDLRRTTFSIGNVQTVQKEAATYVRRFRKRMFFR
jgi:hypothetical protein